MRNTLNESCSVSLSLTGVIGIRWEVFTPSQLRSHAPESAP